jgi:phosphoglycerate dehydrogenase-like enzyme
MSARFTDSSDVIERERERASLPVIASQLPPAINRRLAQLIGEPVLDIPAGLPSALPGNVQILFATPPRMHGGPLDAPAPAGWPFQLRWIQLGSVGIDAYPGWFFDGPPVTTARGTSAEPIAEYVIANLFDAAKNLGRVWLNEAGDWSAPGGRPTLGLLTGTTLGLFGFGAIGQAVATRALALGIRVLALRRGASRFEIDGVERASDVEDLLARSDHVVLAAPATVQTRHVINRRTLAAARPGLHLVNVARGSLIDDDALLEALADGRVVRATLDVTEPEPLPAGHAYYGHPRVRLSPHISPSSPRGPQVLLGKFADNLARHRAGETLVDVVDLTRGY